jgi:hypothetical protein
MFSFVGSSVATGGGGGTGTQAGGGKRLFWVSSADAVCFGSIGGSKICVRPCSGGKSCGIPTHGSRKAKVVVDAFYVMENDQKIYAEPKLHAVELSDDQRLLLQSRELTREQWANVFLAIDQGEFPDWMPVDTHMKSPPLEVLMEDLQLESPGKAIAKAGIFKVFPSLSYEDDASSGAESADSHQVLTTEEVTTSIREFKQRFAKIKRKWTAVFQDLEANHLMVATDLDKLSSSTNVLSARIGSPPDSGTIDIPVLNVWHSLTHMYSKVQHGLSNALKLIQVNSESLEDLSTNYVSIHATYDTLSQSMTKVQEVLQRHESRFAKILPFMRNAHQSGAAQTSTSALLMSLDQKIVQMEQAIETLQDKQWQAAYHPSSSSIPSFGSSSEVENKIRDLEAKIQMIQMRIVGNGVQIGGTVFQCFEDVKTWVLTKFPIKRYGLFVDGVSLLDFFTFVSHTDTEKSMAAFYNSQKSGFTSMFEARLAASTQNLFPMVFGRTNSGGMDDSEYLPALMDPDKWDNGMTGLRYQINRGMSDVEFQLESTIDSVLRDYPEPKQIAKDCLYKAKRFVTDLCSFISNDYQKWLHRGHSKKDSWRMTSVCVRRVFEEIHSQRVVARDILDLQDGDFSCAKFLWATWKAHETMSLYVRHQFYEHPSIAAVLARHLADNHVKPDEAVSTKVGNIEKAIKHINSRLDSAHDSVKNSLEKVEKVSEKVSDLKSDLVKLKENQNSKQQHKKNGKEKEKHPSAVP